MGGSVLFLAAVAGAAAAPAHPSAPATEAVPVAGPTAADPRLPPPILATPLEPPAPVLRRFSREGTPILVRPVPELRRVRVSVLWSAGRAQLCPRTPAACDGLVALLPRGPAGMEGAVWEHALDVRGVWLQAWVGVDQSGLEMSVPAEHLAEALVLLREVLIDPGLPPWDVRATRRAWRTELRQEWPHNPAILRDQIYAGHWLGPELAQAAAGTEDLSELRRLRAGPLQRVHRDLLDTPAVVLVGGGWTPPPAAAPSPASTPAWEGLLAVADALVPAAAPRPHAREPRPGRRIVAVDTGPPAPSSTDGGPAPVWVCAARVSERQAPEPLLLSAVLWSGSTGRLDRELREQRGWTYGSEADSEESAGLLRHWMQLQIAPQHAGPTITFVEETLQELAERGPTAEEASMAAALVRAAANREAGSPEGARDQALRAWTGAPAPAPSIPPPLTAALAAPAAAVQRGAAAWADPQAPGLWIVVGPRAVLADSLATTKIPVEWWGWTGRRLEPTPSRSP